jgi:hypothetical protein
VDSASCPLRATVYMPSLWHEYLPHGKYVVLLNPMIREATSVGLRDRKVQSMHIVTIVLHVVPYVHHVALAISNMFSV